MTKKPYWWIGGLVMLFINASCFVGGVTPSPLPGMQVQEIRQLVTTKLAPLPSGHRSIHRTGKLITYQRTANRAKLIYLEIRNDHLVVTYFAAGEKISFVVPIAV